jgi:hypothetical protein
MRSRLFWRRSAAAAGTYASAALGFGATVLALHVFSTVVFGLYALVLAMTAFVQSLLDLTVEEALVKFGFPLHDAPGLGTAAPAVRERDRVQARGRRPGDALLLAIAPFANHAAEQGTG